MTNDDAARAFERRWQEYSAHCTGEPPDPIEALAMVPEGQIATQVRRVIEIDCFYRHRAACGCTALMPDAYHRMFPNHYLAVEQAFRPNPLDADEIEIPPLICPSCQRNSLGISKPDNVFRCEMCGATFELRPSAGNVSCTSVSTVSNYQVIGLLGEGGFARVWLAKDSFQFVALKIPRHPLTEKLERHFLKEMEIEYRNLKDPRLSGRIPRLLGCGKDAGIPYIAFEFVDATPLSERMSEFMADHRGAMQIVERIADTLQFAHEGRIIHRDVKPSNILITSTGKALLTDFGIARSTRPEGNGSPSATQGFLGTLRYASPEHENPGSLDERSDVFSLGLVLFELLTGKHAFEAKGDVATFGLICGDTEAPPPSKFRTGMSPALDEICKQCLAKDPAKRFGSCGALASELRKVLQGHTDDPPLSLAPVPAATPTPVPAATPNRMAESFGDSVVQSFVAGGILVVFSLIYLVAARLVDSDRHSAYAVNVMPIGGVFIAIGIATLVIRRATIRLDPVITPTLQASVGAGIAASIVGGIVYGYDLLGAAYPHPNETIQRDGIIRLVRFILFGTVVAIAYGLIFSTVEAARAGRRIPAGSIGLVCAVFALALWGVSVISQNIVEWSLGSVLGPTTQGDIPYQVIVLSMGVFAFIIITMSNWAELHSLKLVAGRAMVCLVALIIFGAMISAILYGRALGPAAHGYTNTILGLGMLTAWSLSSYFLFTGKGPVVTAIDRFSRASPNDGPQSPPDVT